MSDRMKRILFVCHGNICRSPMAEYICKQIRKDIYCESRAVSYEEEGNDIYPPAKRCLERHDIGFRRHRARRISREDYENFDRIYVMDDFNMSYIRRIIDDRDGKISLLSDEEIADPYYSGDYEGVFRQLYESILKL